MSTNTSSRPRIMSLIQKVMEIRDILVDWTTSIIANGVDVIDILSKIKDVLTKMKENPILMSTAEPASNLLWPAKVIKIFEVGIDVISIMTKIESLWTKLTPAPDASDDMVTAPTPNDTWI